MPCIFVVDDSAKVPSRLVQRLMAAEYHVLCLADCRTALESLRCIRPDLVIVDVAARPCAAAEELLKLLNRDGGGGAHGAGGGRGPRVARAPVIVVGATLEDQRVLSELLDDGEIVPAARSSPDEVVRRVGRLLAPERVPRARLAGPTAVAEPPERRATRRPGVPTTSARA